MALHHAGKGHIHQYSFLTTNNSQAITVRWQRKGATETNFSDIAGKLSWEGNALAEQKRLRAEWD